MSAGDVWADRGRALEESFFHKRDGELMAKLSQQLANDEKKQALHKVCGIADDAVLEALVNADISAETVAALALVPLVAVAWADGKMADSERKAILSSSESEGIEADCVSHDLLESWLSEQPEAGLTTAWKDYVGVIASTLTHDAQRAFQADVMGRAEKVARAAGGVLGLSSISTDEQRVLDDLKSAFPE